ncbi:ATP-dependent DNA helicase RecG [Candidatus Planktophila vernalis]|uniref:ATP-dependent DNA helicase RecG n=1 Tax=Candidatus Planktophila vernalis TaxID=1884907 RepID=A0A249KSM4_9ACTN|nr:ATP-dependent DNA helicase RecG [Candidatus Planktophila vernalis]ASY19803.1 ATP-dependent DNA helicase RecG [Candidatus Planktophila vernalis]
MADLESKLSSVIGDRTAKVLTDTFDIKTVGDLMRHYPRRYLVRGELSDISELAEGDEVTILAEVLSSTNRPLRGRKGSIFEVVVTDGTDKLSLTFFNQAWREKELKAGRQGLFAGKVGLFNGKKQLAHPDYEMIPDGNDVDAAASSFAGKYLPVYPASAKMPSWKISKCVEMAIDSLDEVEDFLPEHIRSSFGYPTLHQGLVQLHRPADLDSAESARERLTFDEAFLLQSLLVLRRNELRKLNTASRKVIKGGILDSFDASLPFQLTGGQKSVCAEIEADLAQDHPMHRLLQGEVGSGKTIVALRAMLAVVDSGGQAALLAPTEVLAAQHLRTIEKLLGPLAQGGTLGSHEGATQVTLITGSQNAAARKAALALAASGDAGIVIGTHALLGEKVEFKDLGLIVVDEQHRFGVEQRDALKEKAQKPPHLLVMTATPIPRTVAMTVFGDLDVSTLRELPLGRQPITTHVIPVMEKPTYLERAWARIQEEVGQGHQAYVVAPRITAGSDENADIDFLFGTESSDIASVEELAPRLHGGDLAGLRVAMLHGRLSSEEKESTMKAFAAGEIDVLVSTTVIEVGVDVANATIMVIMDADRFGVSQLHQLRGRVGRGTSPGLCLLVTNAIAETPARERLDAVAGTVDGFELSRIDLEQRREGDVLGASQSGTQSHLRLLRVLRDEELIEKARTAAQDLIATSLDLTSYPALKKELSAMANDMAVDYLDKG